MGNTYPQYATGYVCIFCGGIAVLDANGTYLCAPDGIEFLGAEIQPERGALTCAEWQLVGQVDSSLAGRARSTKVADTHRTSPLIRCASEFRHRNVVRPIHR